MSGRREKKRTWWPATKLWFAELSAQVGGQQLEQPATYAQDPLLSATHCEQAARIAFEKGDKETSQQHVRAARRAFLPQVPEPTDSAYREALDRRARERLGPVAAYQLGLRHRPGHRGRKPKPWQRRAA